MNMGSRERNRSQSLAKRGKVVDWIRQNALMSAALTNVVSGVQDPDETLTTLKLIPASLSGVDDNRPDRNGSGFL